MTEVTKLLTHPPQNAAEELQRRLVISALQQHQFPPQLSLNAGSGSSLSSGNSSGTANHQGENGGSSGHENTQNLIEKSLSIIIDSKDDGSEVKKEVLDIAAGCDDLGVDDEADENEEAGDGLGDQDNQNNADQDSDLMHGMFDERP